MAHRHGALIENEKAKPALETDLGIALVTILPPCMGEKNLCFRQHEGSRNDKASRARTREALFTQHCLNRQCLSCSSSRNQNSYCAMKRKLRPFCSEIGCR